MKSNEKGFGAIEALLLIVIVGIIAGAGWLVYKSQKDTNDTLDNSRNSSEVTTPAQKSDPTADWTAYSSKEGKFSLKYPKSWASQSDVAVCGPGLLILGVNKNAVGICGSDKFTQMEVSSSEGEMGESYSLNSEYYPDLKVQEVTVDGVKGEKQTGTFKNIEGQDRGLLPADGSKQVVYIFHTKDRIYYAKYFVDAEKDFPDALDDFNTMVTKTLKFES